jgi:hypothetical protein
MPCTALARTNAPLFSVSEGASLQGTVGTVVPTVAADAAD